MKTIMCPECDCYVEILPQVLAGDRVMCRHCSASLEVISTDPLEVDWAYDGPQADAERFFQEAWF